MSQTLVRRIYVWDIPVRVYHWLNFLAITALAVTGFLIGDPPAFQTTGEAYTHYWFGTVRFVHFAAAFIFIFNFIFRIYWGFGGNKYASWRGFIPHSKAQLREILDVLKLDVLQRKGSPLISIGHNALAGLTYFISFLVFLFQAATGLALYSKMSGWFFAKWFAWIVPFMGGDEAVRQWHHVMLWFFVLFAMVHVYLVFYHDYVEGRGVISSMAGGWKFIEDEGRK